jgi:hypothetical protein
VRRPALIVTLGALFVLMGCSHEREPPRTAAASPGGQWAGRGATAGGGQWTGKPAPAPIQPAPIAWPGIWAPTGFQWPAGWANWTVPGWGQTQPNPQPNPQPAASGVAQRCVDGINRYRATKGLSALVRAVANEPCANSESAEDARTQQAHGSFGACRERAQNACPNWPGPAEKMIDECLASMWSEGPGEFPEHGHYENMVDPSSTSVACGFVTQPDGTLWAVQDFF